MIKSTGAYFISSVLLFLSLMVLICFLVCSLFPYRVAHVKSPAEVITKEIKAGEALEYRFEAIVFNSYHVVEVRRILYGGFNLILEPNHPPDPKVGHVRTVVGSNIIPANTPSGEYIMRFEARHQVNPIRTVSVKWETEKFIVINKE